MAAVLGDAALIGAVAAGHGWAMAEVHRRHGTAVRRAALRVVGDHALAEDVAQEVFIRVWCAPHLYDPGRGTLRAFLQRDARGRGIDLVRNEESRRRRELRVVADAPARAHAGPDRADEWEDVRHALGRLPADMRAAVDLAFYAGCTYRQVAALLDIPEGTAKSRLRRALAVLRAALAAEAAVAPAEVAPAEVAPVEPVPPAAGPGAVGLACGPVSEPPTTEARTGSGAAG